MKIYLSGAIRGGRKMQPIYKQILNHLQDNHTILTYHVASENVQEMENSMNDTEIFTQDIKWLNECDVVIAEISIPSLGVGYELAYSLIQGKPVLALYDENFLPISAMISGNTSPYLTLNSYNGPEELLEHLDQFIKRLDPNA